MIILNHTGKKCKQPARRIISLVPSLTELLSSLDLDEETIGITKFCVRPHHWFRTKLRMGGTKDVKIHRVLEEQPDLVIASKEENVKEQIEAIAAHCPVMLTDVNNFHDALVTIDAIGHYCNRQKQAEEMVTLIKERFHDLALQKLPRKKVAYFIWRDPWMVAGGDTYINNLLWKAGFENVFGHKERYPEISFSELKMLNPDILLFASEPFPFQPHHTTEIEDLLPQSASLFVDGEMFSWYGSRMLQVPAYIVQLRSIPPPFRTLVLQK